jgi:hypothetical protein
LWKILGLEGARSINQGRSLASLRHGMDQAVKQERPAWRFNGGDNFRDGSLGKADLIQNREARCEGVFRGQFSRSKAFREERPELKNLFGSRSHGRNLLSKRIISSAFLVAPLKNDQISRWFQGVRPVRLTIERSETFQ